MAQAPPPCAMLSSDFASWCLVGDDAPAARRPQYALSWERFAALIREEAEPWADQTQTSLFAGPDVLAWIRADEGMRTFVKKLMSRKNHKNVAKSEKWRKCGNEQVGAKDYEEALHTYTQTTIFATGDGLALALANRSAALLSLANYGDCVLDCEAAQATNMYPVGLMYKLLLREATALSKLKLEGAAKLVLLRAKEHLPGGQFKTDAHRKRATAQVASAMDRLAKVEASTPEQFQVALKGIRPVARPSAPRLVSGRLPELPDGVELLSEPGRGDFLVAKGAFRRGEVVFQDTPVGFVNQQEWTSCAHCGIKTRSLVPCLSCAGLLYCSVSCRTEAQETCHWLTCGVGGLWEALDWLPKLCLRTLATRGRAHPGFGQESTTQERGRLLPFVHHLRSQSAGVRLSFKLTAGLITHILSPRLAAAGWTDRAVYQELIVLQSQAQCNVFAIPELVVASPQAASAVEEVVQVRAGHAFYPNAAMLNHSCAHNLEARFEGSVVSLVAIRDLAAGEPLTHCYGPSPTRMGTAERQKLLQTQYKFRCDCEACKIGAGAAKEVILLVKCADPSCEGFSPVYKSHRNRKPTTILTCPVCGAKMKVPDAHITEMAVLTKKAIALLSKGKTAEGFRTIQASLSIRGAIVHRDCVSNGVFYDQAAKALAAVGAFDFAADCCAASTAAVEFRFGESLELGRELFKLVTLELRAQRLPKDVLMCLTKRALKILQRTAPFPEDPDIMSLKQVVAQLARS